MQSLIMEIARDACFNCQFRCIGLSLVLVCFDRKIWSHICLIRPIQLTQFVACTIYRFIALNLDTDGMLILASCRKQNQCLNLIYWQICFESEERAKMLLHNASSLLKPGGYFIGITPDSSMIWYGTVITVIISLLEKMFSSSYFVLLLQFIRFCPHYAF